MKKKKIDWLNHVISFAVVLLGILLAFQLSQWSENRKQQKTIDNHLYSLQEETEFNKNRLKWSVSYAEKNLLKVDSLIVLIKQGEDLANIDRLAVELLNLTRIYFKRNAYNGLVESNDMSFINDFNSKSEIIMLYEYYNSAENTDNISYKHSYIPFSNYLQENFDLLNKNIQNEEVYTSMRFGNIIGSYRYFLNQRIKTYKLTQEKIDEYLEK